MSLEQGHARMIPISLNSKVVNLQGFWIILDPTRKKILIREKEETGVIVFLALRQRRGGVELFFLYIRYESVIF